MKLATLLASATDDELAKLASEHVRTDEPLSRAQLCNFLESAILSFRFVHDFLVNRQPPTFAFLTLLLDASGFELPTQSFKEAVLAETNRIADLIEAGDLLAREDQLYVYRRALYEARRNDFDVNSSEAAILSTLRQVSDIAQVEHFLIEHHPDFKEFWSKEDAFEHEDHALRSGGLVFVRDHKIVIPEDVAPAVSQSLGIEMATDSLRRLLGFLSSGDLATALEWSGSRTSGSREQRLERIILERIQPRVVLRGVDGESLRSICRETGAQIGGKKEDLIDRILEHFSQRRDQTPEEIPEAPPIEEKRLAKSPFETLFSSLTHQELSDILRRFPDLRQSGSKETKISTLWEAHLSETTFLAELMNRDLENVLYRLGLRLGGSKQDRIERIIAQFSGEEPASDRSLEEAATETSHSEDSSVEYSTVQNLFHQRAANPSAMLQPWLDEILGAEGNVRCYATEDPNPTKQLKNKLSQAASANGGLLILLLNDQDAFNKTSEALVERWMTNDEWPKAVACVALGYPLGNPSMKVAISNRANEWPTKLKERLFPEMVAVPAIGATMNQPKCAQCNELLGPSGRFCPNCGAKRE